MNKIRMKRGRLCSYNPLDIQGLYIDFIYHDTAEVYDYIAETGQRIDVDGKNGAYLIHVLALNGSKYLRSAPSESFVDYLFDLPRE